MNGERESLTCVKNSRSESEPVPWKGSGQRYGQRDEVQIA